VGSKLALYELWGGHDAVIEQNRRGRQENVLILASGEPATADDDTYLGGEALIRPAA